MRVVQSKRKAVGVPPPRKQSASLLTLTLLKDGLKFKDQEIAVLREEIARLEDNLASKDKEIAALVNEKNTTINEEIVTLKESLKKRESELIKQYMSTKPPSLVDIVDLTTDDEAKLKRQHTGDTPKSNLAIQHEQNQKIVQKKDEKTAAETALKDAREDLEDNQEDMGRQVLFTDFLQSKIDELAALAEAGGADRARVAEIKGRSYSSTRS